MQTDDCEESVELIQEHLSTQTEIDEAIVSTVIYVSLR
jgi:hypothetical protein